MVKTSEQRVRVRRSFAQSLRNAPAAATFIIANIDIVKFICLLVLIYCLITSLAPVPYGVLESSITAPCDEGVNRCICPRETICATSVRDMIFLVIARGSIYLVYPFIMLLFLTKARHLSAYLQRNLYSVFFDFEDIHKIHRLGGLVVEIATWIHVLFHLIRWGLRGDIDLLTKHITGRTGLVAIIITPLITWPMKFKFIKDRLSFEYRKSLHYLSWIWGLAMVFHAPAVNIFWVMGSALVVYFIDWLLSTHRYTYLVESTIFRKLGNSTLLSFSNPEGFKLEVASYVLVMLPWLSKTQWHAFSVFPHPEMENTSSVCIAAAGDWTKELHRRIERPTARPAWICGPFLSPFSTALNYDHIITVATGIGITPALAVMGRYKNNRRINLIWSCRDASLIEFFVNMVEFPLDSFIFIFYTGKAPLSLGNDAPPNVLVFKGRPNLERVITSMIYRIETNFLLPEEIVQEGHQFREMTTDEKGEYLISKIALDYDPEEFYEAASVEIPKNVLGFGSERTLDIEGPSSGAQAGRRSSITFAKPSERRGSLLVSNLAAVKMKKLSRRGSHISVGSGGYEIAAPSSSPQAETKPRPGSNMRSRSKTMLKKTSRRGSMLSERRLLCQFGVIPESFSLAVQDFFGNITYSPEEIMDVFNKIDKKGQGYIMEDDFFDFFDQVTLENNFNNNGEDEEHGKKTVSWIEEIDHNNGNTDVTRSSIDNSLSRKGKRFRKSEFISTKPKKTDTKDEKPSEMDLIADEQMAYIRSHPEEVKTWQMLYCGGSAPIIKNLKEISEKYDIDFSIEKFDW